MRITTGVKSIDGLLKGGIETGVITQIYGGFGTGKSILAQQLCITSQLYIPSNEVSPSSIFIDTEGSFSPPRLMKIASRFNIDTRLALKRILYKRVWSFEEQDKILRISRDYLERYGIKVIVIDCVSTHLRGEYNQDLMIIRQHSLESHLKFLLEVCSRYEIAGIITNQVTSGPFGDKEKFTEKPVGGNVIVKYCKNSIRLVKFKEKRYAELLEELDESSNFAPFVIKEDGLHDAND